VQDLESQLSWTQRQLRDFSKDMEGKAGEPSDAMDARFKSDLAKQEEDECIVRARLAKLSHLAEQVPSLAARVAGLLQQRWECMAERAKMGRQCPMLSFLLWLQPWSMPT
jgi:hypothetical protein